MGGGAWGVEHGGWRMHGVEHGGCMVYGWVQHGGGSMGGGTMSLTAVRMARCHKKYWHPHFPVPPLHES